jgi:hypothetical protein
VTRSLPQSVTEWMVRLETEAGARVVGVENIFGGYRELTCIVSSIASVGMPVAGPL